MDDESMPFVNEFLPPPTYKKNTKPENELMELLWQNGNVVMHCQTSRKTTAPEIKHCQKVEALKSGEPLETTCNNLHVEETMPWLQYADDPLEKEFYSDFFYGLSATESSTVDKLEEVIAVDKSAKYGNSEEIDDFAHSFAKPPNVYQFEQNVMPPPKSANVTAVAQTPSAGSGGVAKFSCFSRPPKADLLPLSGSMGNKTSGNGTHCEVGQSSSMTTKGSSFCSSNHVQNQFDLSWSNAMTVPSAKCTEEESQTRLSRGRTHSDMHETAITSSSGGSGCSFGRTEHANMKNYKRKGRDVDESECQSEETEYESAEAKRPPQRSAPTRRSRAAEVHNLSERRRRDRINEKMKALQELIPHCNKTDKASMLDEAIEYLKSLQIQVQMMWMGGGMTPMLFPGMQHYMPPMDIGLGHGVMPSVPGSLPFPRIPLINQSITTNPIMNQAYVRPSTGVSTINFQNQIQNAHIPESYARYLGFHHMQQLPQAMNLYAYGSQLVEKGQTTPTASIGAPCDGGG